MIKIAVASQNPVKINSTEQAFSLMFPDEKFICTGISVPSDVADQPSSEEETILGATNRVNNIIKLHQQYDYYVGIEGGVADFDNDMIVFAWTIISDKINIGKGRSASFFLPQPITDLIRQGKELGEADDIVFGKNNSKQSNGSVGLLSGDVITRESLYIPMIVLALFPFYNKNLYENNK
jgi:inosine/xanthosine triphosphatase